ncbi:tRNA (guanine(10)-N(2))-methyltransferase homolog isoform X2 [Apostichopus japonicus]
MLKFPNEESVHKYMTRSILGRTVMEVLAHGPTRASVCEQLKALPAAETSRYCSEENSFCWRVHSFGKKIKQDKRLDLIHQFMVNLPLKGRVDLENPDDLFYICEDYGPNPNSAPEEPFYVYVGRKVSEGQRYLAHQYSVKTRHFIGNTSMDAQLSLIMANQGGVKPNMFVFDPFVGTGSLLVAAAHFGGYVAGCDINVNTIHGVGKSSRSFGKPRGEVTLRGNDENILANMRQYNLHDRYLDVMVSDFALNVWREQELFDVIVTDPPYGIREKTRKIGTNKHYDELEDQTLEGHIPSTMSYHLADIFKDLLNFSARYLRLHGRLVYWLPVVNAEYSDDHIPQHPCLKVIANSEQKINMTISRRLITMEKYQSMQNINPLDQVEAEIKTRTYEGSNAIRKIYFPNNSGCQSHNKSLPLT